MTAALAAASVAAAAARIADRVHRAPVLTSRTLDRELGARLFFKCENLNAPALAENPGTAAGRVGVILSGGNW